ncbi:MAG: nucleotidyltransferase domain-containing protein [Balneolales bacterium]
MQSSQLTEIALEQHYLDSIIKVASSFLEIEHIYLFGSRSVKTNRKASDIDLALAGKNVTHSTVLRLHDVLNQETMIPYQIDVVNYNAIQNRQLKNHIKKTRVGDL